MGLISRMFFTIRAKISALLEGTENPATTLDYSYQRQLKLLEDVKHGMVEVTTSRRRLDLEAQKIRAKVEKLDGQARFALEKGREDLARLALERKQAGQMRLNDLHNQIAGQQASQQKLASAEGRLRAKVESFRTRKETIKAQYSAAEAQVRIGEAVTGLSDEMADIGLSIQRASEKTEKMRARALAIDELTHVGLLTDHIGGDQIDRELAQLTTGVDVESELQSLKRQLAAPKMRPQLVAA